jgi:L-ascorbate metabolism protein UlaG (beta-lactamase superfamily)
MKATWLGQGGFFFEGEECSVMIDPYLSNSLFESMGNAFTRLVPVDESFLSAKPDVLVLTHAHGDHADKATLARLLSGPKEIEVLCPSSVYYELRKVYGSSHNMILFDRSTEWTKNGITFKAIKAVHSDPSPIGVRFTMEERSIYVTGDTLYDASIFGDLDGPVDYLFVCINGTGNNMNISDALRFTRKVGPKTVVPVHWGLFEKYSADPNVFISGLAGTGIETRKLEFFTAVEI